MLTKFNVELGKSCMVGGTHEHTPFKIMLDGKWVGNGLNVECPDGCRYIRIFDYNWDYYQELYDYFRTRKGVDEVSLSNPYEC